MYLSPGARPISGQLSSSNSVNLDLSVKEKNDKRLSAVVEWLNSMCPHQKLSSEASEEELRVFLKNGTVFCDILNKISPDSVPEDPGASAGQSLDYVKKFLLVIEDMGLPGFEVSDLEKGSMKAVVECLLILRDDMNATDNHDTKSTTKFKRQLRRLYLSEIINGVRMNRSMQRLNSFPEERSCSSPDTKFQRVLQSPIAAEPPTAMLHHAGQKFHEVFQLKQGRYSDLPAARISEMMKLNSLDNAPTQSLMSVVNGILDESIERKNGEIPQQNNLIKAREERYLSRIKVLEALATGTNEESQLIMNQLKQIKNEKARIEDTKKLGEQDFMRLTKEKKNGELAISKLKEEIETTKRTYEERCLQLEKQAEETQLWEHGVFRPAKDKESSDLAILALKEELETTKRTSEERCFQLKKQAEETQLREHDVVRLAKDKESSDLAILALKEELETTKRTYEERCFRLKNQAEETQVREHDVVRLTKDKESSDLAILALKEELQTTKRTYEEHCLQLEKQAKETQLREHDVVRLTKDKESSDLAILALKEELQTTKRTYEERCLQLEKQAEETQLQEHDVVRLMKDKESSDLAILALKEELQTTKRTYEERCLQLEKQAKESKVELEEKLKEVEYLLTELRNRKELEAISASKIQIWNEKERSYQSSIGYHFQMLQELRASSGSIKNEINNAQQIWQEEFSDLWITLKQMANATENYQIVLSENRKLYNDVQDLKGKIRVYCRIRPFLPGQTGKQSTIDYIGEDGELIVANPSKQGKDGQRMFKFNKVFGPMATQGSF